MEAYNVTMDFFNELIIDNFAGGGGASTGIELATGRPVNIAINHDPDAILMHKTNHPNTIHYQESVWDIDPVKVCGGKPVGLAWFSPDCKHFSKAKGKPLVDREIRGLSWVILRWGMQNPPRVILMENVEEIQTWGPLVSIGKDASGKEMFVPDPDRNGETFQGFIKMLTTGIQSDHPAFIEACDFLGIASESAESAKLQAGLGYDVEYRELVAADYGAPTTRKRFVLIARCDGRPIVWPRPTHSKNGENGLKKWISAAEIIDWTQPCYSIFESKKEIKSRYGVNTVRPLAENTLRRIIRGVDRFTIKSGKPFLIQGKFQNQAQSMDKPLSTITAVGAHELCRPVLSPLKTFSAANLIQYHTEQTEAARVQGLDDPLKTTDTSNRYALTSVNLVEYYGNGNSLSMDEPMHTVTGKDREAFVAVHLAEFKGQDIGQSVTSPLRTITAFGGEFAECRAVLTKADGRDLQHWSEIMDLLNRFCGYQLKNDDVLLLIINGCAYYISDILLRMLTPRELYSAMGFPHDYVIDKDYEGNVYGKTKQVARCGNAVCPPMAEALVRANYYSAPVKFLSMEQLVKYSTKNKKVS